MGELIRFPYAGRARRLASILPVAIKSGLLAGALFAALATFGPSSSGEPPRVTRLRVNTERPGSPTLVGRATVTDGDTIRLQGEAVRLNGIDAPEARQSCQDARGASYACGRVSANALDAFLAQSRPTRCEAMSRDKYDRVIARCFRADGADVAAWLVRNGHAVEWPRYSDGQYSREQASARAAKDGVWQGPFEMPWDWRASKK